MYNPSSLSLPMFVEKTYCGLVSVGCTVGRVVQVEVSTAVPTAGSADRYKWGNNSPLLLTSIARC